MNVDRVEKKTMDDGTEVVFVRLREDGPDGVRYHRTSFNAHLFPRVLREVEADLGRKGWGRLEDEDRRDLKDVVPKLFQPDGTKPSRPRPMTDRAWQQVGELLGIK